MLSVDPQVSRTPTGVPGSSNHICSVPTIYAAVSDLMKKLDSRQSCTRRQMMTWMRWYTSDASTGCGRI